MDNTVIEAYNALERALSRSTVFFVLSLRRMSTRRPLSVNNATFVENGDISRAWGGIENMLQDFPRPGIMFTSICITIISQCSCSRF